MSLADHVCSTQERWELRDARGIFCCYVCVRCRDAKRRRFRAEIFNNPNYETTEQVKED